MYSRRNHLFSVIVVLSACAGATGCLWGTGDEPGAKPRRSLALTGDGGCPPDACGTNGTRLADSRLGALDLDGAANPGGFAIVGFAGPGGELASSPPGGLTEDLALDVVGGRLVAASRSAGGVAERVHDLAGGSLALAQAGPDGARQEWTLWIEAAGAVPHASTEPGAIPTYALALSPRDRPDRRAPLCPGGGAAILVAGERYDPATLDVGAGARWLHIACEGDLLWKTARMSYDSARAASDPYHTTAAQRRAALAMLAADYCGTGQRFTMPGTPLYWQNRAGWMSVGGSPAPTATVEAGWDARGAVCLNTPRLAEVHARGDVEVACGRAIPACTPELLAASEWITWRP